MNGKATDIFRQSIEAQSPVGRDFNRHTIGDLIGAIMAIVDEQYARQFYNSYVAWLYLHHEDDSRLSPEQIAQQNIGWCFGEGMPPERRQMWVQVCGAYHPMLPFLANYEPTVAEAIQAGIDKAQEAKGTE